MFKDKVVLITGGSRGIGKATALQFAKQGAKLILVYKGNDKSMKNLVKKISDFGGQAIQIKADLSIESELQRIAHTAFESYGRIDILVNNAGIVFDREFEEITYDESLEIIKTNMLAPLFLSQKIAPYMMKNKGACIVNVSSTSGLYDFCPGTADYNMSKLALQSLTKDLSMKFAPSIRVNAVAPGWVDTDMNANLDKKYIKEELSKYHLKRMAKPDEIADVILFLASEKAKYITGQVVVLDGGHC